MSTNHAIVIKSTCINPSSKNVFLKKGKKLSTSDFNEAHCFNSNAEALTFLANEPECFKLNNKVVKIYF